VLVSQVGEVIDAINIVPDVLFWKVSNWLQWLLDEVNLWLVRGLSAWEVWVNELKVLVGSGGADEGNVNGVLHMVGIK
jgi:hypothetical protein